MKAAQRVFIFLLLLVVVQSIYYYPQLPERVAQNFDWSGWPNGWASKGEFFGFLWGAVVLVAGSFFGLSLFLPRFPKKWINLPHKDYWWAPERRAETAAEIGRQMVWFGNTTLIFIMGVFHLLVEANLTEPPRLSPAAFQFLVAYVLFTLLWVVRLVFKFRKTG